MANTNLISVTYGQCNFDKVAPTRRVVAEDALRATVMMFYRELSTGKEFPLTSVVNTRTKANPDKALSAIQAHTRPASEYNINHGKWNSLTLSVERPFYLDCFITIAHGSGFSAIRRVKRVYRVREGAAHIKVTCDLPAHGKAINDCLVLFEGQADSLTLEDLEKIKWDFGTYGKGLYDDEQYSLMCEEEIKSAQKVEVPTASYTDLITRDGATIPVQASKIKRKLTFRKPLEGK